MAAKGKRTAAAEVCALVTQLRALPEFKGERMESIASRLAELAAGKISNLEDCPPMVVVWRGVHMVSERAASNCNFACSEGRKDEAAKWRRVWTETRELREKVSAVLSMMSEVWEETEKCALCGGVAVNSSTLEAGECAKLSGGCGRKICGYCRITEGWPRGYPLCHDCGGSHEVVEGGDCPKGEWRGC